MGREGDEDDLRGAGLVLIDTIECEIDNRSRFELS